MCQSVNIGRHVNGRLHNAVDTVTQEIHNAVIPGLSVQGSNILLVSHGREARIRVKWAPVSDEVLGSHKHLHMIVVQYFNKRTQYLS